MLKPELILFVIPVIVVFAVLFLYRFQGKKYILNFDLVQFLYNFVFAPLVFVWIKSIFFVILTTSPDLILSVKQVFFADTLFSLVFLYIYAFFSMHSLTKTFHLKNFDPLYDLFYDSEYIHLWLSHIVLFLGTMLILTILAIANLFAPFTLVISSSIFSLVLFVAFLLGVGFYLVLLISEPLQQKRLTLSRLVKLGIGVAFSAHLIGYYFGLPNISSAYLFYWSSVLFFAGAFILAFLDYRFNKISNTLDSFVSHIKYQGWGENIQLFNKK